MNKRQLTRPMIAALIAVSFSGCYMYHERDKVLLEGIDIDQTLEVAALEMEENKWSSVLTIWAIRDQVLTGDQAAQISEIYFDHIERIDSEEQKAREFSVWHLSWAISNIYRQGDEESRHALKRAYDDAETRVEKLDKKIASTHFKGEKIYMGDAHGGGRGYAKRHLVVPGNHRYLQSFEEFQRND